MLAPAATRRFVTWLLALSVFVLSLARAAAAAEPDESQLEAGIQQGIALRRGGNDEGALAVFLDLEKSNPGSIRLLLHITTAAQASGRWLLAHAYFRKASAHKGDPYFVRYRTSIKAIEDAIDQHVGLFRAVGTPEGAEVRLNGELVGTLPMAEAKPIDVGQYTLDVTRPGFYPLRRSVSVGPGSTLTQEAVQLNANTGPRPAAQGSEHNERGPLAQPPWYRARWITWTLGGATVVAGATSGVALLMRNRSADHWNDDSRCLDNTSRTRDEVCGSVRKDINFAQDVAVGAGIAAGVLATATLTHLLIATDRPATTDARARRFDCSPGLGTVLCSGNF